MTVGRFFVNFSIAVLLACTAVNISNGQTVPVLTPAETSFDQSQQVPAVPTQVPAGQQGAAGTIVSVCANIPGVVTVPAGLVKEASGNCVISTQGVIKESTSRSNVIWWAVGIILAVVCVVLLLKKKKTTTEPNNSLREKSEAHSAPAEMPSDLYEEREPAHNVPAPPPIPGTATMFLIGMLCLGAMSFVAPAAQAAGLCDGTSITSFYPAAGAIGSSSRSVVEGKFEHVTGIQFAGQGVTASTVSTPTQLIVNWSIAANAAMTPRQVRVSCSDGSTKTFATFFSVAKLEDLQQAERAWGVIPPQIQRLMNQPAPILAPAAPPQVVRTTVYRTDAKTKAQVADLWKRYENQNKQLTQLQNGNKQEQVGIKDLEDMIAKDPQGFRDFMSKYMPAAAGQTPDLTALVARLVETEKQLHEVRLSYNNVVSRVGEIQNRLHDDEGFANDTRRLSVDTAAAALPSMSKKGGASSAFCKVVSDMIALGNTPDFKGKKLPEGCIQK